jgi:hypothetical protein
VVLGWGEKGTLSCGDAGGCVSGAICMEGGRGRGTYFQNMGLNAIESAATGGVVVSFVAHGHKRNCVGMKTYLLNSFDQSQSTP